MHFLAVLVRLNKRGRAKGRKNNISQVTGTKITFYSQEGKWNHVNRAEKSHKGMNGKGGEMRSGHIVSCIKASSEDSGLSIVNS